MFKQSLPLAALLMAGSAHAAYFQHVVPAEHVVNGLDKVVIVEVEGDVHSRNIAQKAAAILNGNVGWSNVPAEETGLSANTSSNVVSLSSTPSSSRIAELARQNNAQIVMVGSMSAKRSNYETYEEDRVRYEGKGDNKKKIEYTVNCAKADYIASWSVNYYDARGELITKAGDSNSTVFSDCNERGDDKLSMPEAKAYLAGLDETAARSVYRITPHWTRFSAPLVDLPSADAINSHLSAGRWNEALEESEAMLADDPYNVAPILAAAVVHEIHGDLDRADYLYQEGAKLNLKQADAFRTGRVRIVRRRDELNLLRQWDGYEPELKDVSASTPVFDRLQAIQDTSITGEPSMASRLQNNKRVDIYDRDDRKADPVSTVPNGTRVYLVRESKRMSEIMFSDGQTAWIRNRNVKAD